MKTLKKHDDKLNIAYIVILLLYPMLRVNQGLSVMDTTYSLANFTFFDRMNGTWMVATYLSNVVGSVLTKLPFGGTLLGINIYTSLIVGWTAVVSYLVLRRDVNQHIVFLGEVLALSLCWCPTTILYNYLTYHFFTLGALLLYRSLAGAKDDRFVAAGIVLGISVAVRFPNVTEAALILALWYVAFIERKKTDRIIRETLRCFVGYLLGFVFFFIIISLRYGAGAYASMINTLFAMTDKATDYKPTSMITAMFADYIYAAKWVGLFVVVILAGACICAIGDKILSGRARIIMPVMICMGTLLAFRICYGQGMFTFRYYEYRSMYYPAILLLAAVSVVCIGYIFVPESRVIQSFENRISTETDSAKEPVIVNNSILDLHHKKILAAIVLIEVYITCLGSNNGMYPIVNNMFLAAPFMLWVLYDWFGGLVKSKGDNSENQSGKASNRSGKLLQRSFTISALTVLLAVYMCTFVQGIGFHMNFALQDGDDGIPRNSQVRGHAVTDHIYTTEANAYSLQGVMDYVRDNGSEVGEVILYGDDPGLGYLLDKPSAFTTFWPDLDSYTYDEWSRDLKVINDEVAGGMPAPYVITSIQVAAWEGGNAEAIDYFGINRDEFGSDDKLNDLVDFIHNNGYVQVYCNDAYSVYYVE